MNIQFFGATHTVTGSMHLLSVNGSQVLLDCGLFQGKRAESVERNRTFPFDPSKISAVVLSHAHIDHAGNLPNLVRNGYRGPIFATAATRDLCNVMLYDSAYIQERDVEYVNKRNERRHEPPAEPLYTVTDVTETMTRFISMNYGEPFDVVGGVRATFVDAGHILGSAVTLYEMQENGRKVRLGFTGDLGRKNSPIIRDPEPIGDVEYFISESTYGGKVHAPITGMKDDLYAVIKRTVDRGGKLIVPAFSVERTQELLYVLSELINEKRVPQIPVYVDSPLAVDATEVFRMHPECFDEETLAHLRSHEDPFGFSRLIYVRHVDESKKLNDIKSPIIVIAASGMCEAGRILHHLANNAGDARNTIMIVGFQAEHTLGRRIVERQPEIKIFGDIYKLRAEVAVMNAFSAHAGQDELLGYIQRMDKKQLKSVFLVHGEEEQSGALAGKLREAGFQNVLIPDRGTKVELS
jgi:metallo-beta-lactamase family protein